MTFARRDGISFFFIFSCIVCTGGCPYIKAIEQCRSVLCFQALYPITELSVIDAGNGARSLDKR